MTSLNRMKKLLASILAVSTCISMLAATASATDVELQPETQSVTMSAETAEATGDELAVDSLTVNIGATEDCLGITWYDTESTAGVLHLT